MDWNSIKAKASELKNTAIEKSKPMMEKAKEAATPLVDKAKESVKPLADKAKESVLQPIANKVGDWGYENASKIPMTLKTGEDFEKVRFDKYLVVFALAKDDAFSDKIFAMSPVLLTRAWIVSATTRLIRNEEESKELLSLLEITTFPSIRIYKKGEIFRTITDLAQMEEFIKDFNVLNLPKDATHQNDASQVNVSQIDTNQNNTNQMVPQPDSSEKANSTQEKPATPEIIDPISHL